MEGSIGIKFDGNFRNIYDRSFPPPELRRLVGTVFQAPNPLPMSIYKNIAFPLKLAGKKDKNLITDKVEKALERAYLWREVKDRLSEDATTLSGGQQQRLNNPVGRPTATPVYRPIPRPGTRNLVTRRTHLLLGLQIRRRNRETTAFSQRHLYAHRGFSLSRSGKSNRRPGSCPFGWKIRGKSVEQSEIAFFRVPRPIFWEKVSCTKA